MYAISNSIPYTLAKQSPAALRFRALLAVSAFFVSRNGKKCVISLKANANKCLDSMDFAVTFGRAAPWGPKSILKSTVETRSFVRTPLALYRSEWYYFSSLFLGLLIIFKTEHVTATCCEHSGPQARHRLSSIHGSIDCSIDSISIPEHPRVVYQLSKRA